MDEKEQAPAQPTAPSPAPSPTPTKEGGYGRSGKWLKWLLIYVVIAVIVYGVIYYFWVGNTTSGY